MSRVIIANDDQMINNKKICFFGQQQVEEQLTFVSSHDRGREMERVECVIIIQVIGANYW